MILTDVDKTPQARFIAGAINRSKLKLRYYERTRDKKDVKQYMFCYYQYRQKAPTTPMR